jgi:hypothetical protein
LIFELRYSFPSLLAHKNKNQQEAEKEADKKEENVIGA